MIALIVLGLLAIVCFAAAVRIATGANHFTPLSNILGALGLLLTIGSIVTYPYVNVWQRAMAGRAQMAEAEANRQIRVREAQAARDAAQLLAEAEVLRAKGVAEANRIVADGLGGPEGYLRYLYIEGLKEAQRQGAQIIYVPTEAGLPILEANRLRH